MDDQACPRCKTTKYRNPSLKLMVNVCGHTLCESCVNLLFLKGSGSCPECLVPLRKNNFRVQLFEDPMVEKEIDIRKRILRDYNKVEEDFETLEEYNNYLEEIEILVFNLCHNIDVINTNKRIEQYKKENREIISKNKSRIGKEEFELEEMLEVEKQQQEVRRLELEEIEQQNKKRKQREKEALIDELIISYEDASKIVNTFAENIEKVKEESKIVPAPKVTQFSTGIKFSRDTMQGFLPIPKFEEGPAYVRQQIKVNFNGPEIPTFEEIISKGYIQYIRSEYPVERTGGYIAVIALQKALQDAFQGLFHGYY